MDDINNKKTNTSNEPKEKRVIRLDELDDMDDVKGGGSGGALFFGEQPDDSDAFGGLSKRGK